MMAILLKVTYAFGTKARCAVGNQNPMPNWTGHDNIAQRRSGGRRQGGRTH